MAGIDIKNLDEKYHFDSSRRQALEFNHTEISCLSSVITTNPDSNYEIVDARGAPRFKGEVAEPRQGVRSGNIPGSKNLPFNKILNQDYTYKDAEGIIQEFTNAGIDVNKEIVGTCGSGVTASVLQLGLETAGVGSGLRRVYDGSWSEYGFKEPLSKEFVDS